MKQEQTHQEHIVPTCDPANKAQMWAAVTREEDTQSTVLWFNDSYSTAFEDRESLWMVRDATLSPASETQRCLLVQTSEG